MPTAVPATPPSTSTSTSLKLVTPTTPRLLYPRVDAAFQLGISVRSLDYLIAGKCFDTRRIGKKVLITHASLVRYAQGNHYGPMKEAA